MSAPIPLHVLTLREHFLKQLSGKLCSARNPTSRHSCGLYCHLYSFIKFKKLGDIEWYGDKSLATCALPPHRNCRCRKGLCTCVVKNNTVQWRLHIERLQIAFVQSGDQVEIRESWQACPTIFTVYICQTSANENSECIRMTKQNPPPRILPNDLSPLAGFYGAVFLSQLQPQTFYVSK